MPGSGAAIPALAVGALLHVWTRGDVGRAQRGFRGMVGSFMASTFWLIPFVPPLLWPWQEQAEMAPPDAGSDRGSLPLPAIQAPRNDAGPSCSNQEIQAHFAQTAEEGSSSGCREPVSQE